jgi:hypothetical protein
VNSGDTDPPFAVPVTGTPLDCSEDLYRFYLETGDVSGTAQRVLRDFLGPRHAERLHRLAHGYEFVAPIQSVPDPGENRRLPARSAGKGRGDLAITTTPFKRPQWRPVTATTTGDNE